MSRRIDLKHIGTLPQALAHVGLVRAMRHYMKTGAAFLACFVIEDAEHVGVYENVAEALLLRRNPDGIRRARDKASVTTFEGGKVIKANIGGSLAGMAAEIEVFGAHDWGAGGREASDLAIATDFATRYEAVLGMGSTLISEVVADGNHLARIRQQNPVVWSRVDALLKGQLAKARSLAAEHKTVLAALADHLVVAKSMSGPEILAFLKSIEFDIAAHAQRAIAVNGRMQCDSGSSPISTSPSRMWSRLLKFLRRTFVWSRATSM